MHSELDKKVAQEKGGRRRGISPSPFPDSVVIAAAESQKVFSFLTTTVVKIGD